MNEFPIFGAVLAPGSFGGTPSSKIVHTFCEISPLSFADEIDERKLLYSGAVVRRLLVPRVLAALAFVCFFSAAVAERGGSDLFSSTHFYNSNILDNK